jgi:hypothetical protein
MNNSTRQHYFVNLAGCESAVIHQTIAPFELLAAGLAGELVINGTTYTVEVLGYLPAEGERVVDGFRLTKTNGEAHDVCLVAGVVLAVTTSGGEASRRTPSFPRANILRPVRSISLHPLTSWQGVRRSAHSVWLNWRICERSSHLFLSPMWRKVNGDRLC